MTTIHQPDVESAWPQVLKSVLHNNVVLLDESGYWVVEKENLLVIVDDASKKYVPPGINFKRMSDYRAQILDPFNNTGFQYTYGQRLRNWFLDENGLTIDQIDRMINRLKANPKSRRAVAITWDPKCDSLSEEDVPCFDIMSARIRDGKLNLSTMLRSSDGYGALYSNIQAFDELQSFMAWELGVDKGPIATKLDVCQIYERDWDAASWIIGEPEYWRQLKYLKPEGVA